jgi:hypothetical protein
VRLVENSIKSPKMCEHTEQGSENQTPIKHSIYITVCHCSQNLYCEQLISVLDDGRSWAKKLPSPKKFLDLGKFRKSGHPSPSTVTRCPERTSLQDVKSTTVLGDGWTPSVTKYGGKVSTVQILHCGSSTTVFSDGWFGLVKIFTALTAPVKYWAKNWPQSRTD